jgi:ATP-binding cassette subfamily E protein 1
MGKKRIAVIDRELCTNVKCGYQCSKVCPINRSGEECIIVEENEVYPVINEDLCIGCLLCVKKCEKLGFRAISVVNLPKELEENPVHRYGKNQFALYRLPIPKEGLVVGLIGPNGIGKTTIVNILSGNLTPNLGFSKGIAWNEIIQRFRGSELQRYLKALSEKKINTICKPQHVDLIPKVWKGKVKELLKLERSKEIIKRLEIEGILEKNVSDISGGELQLLAITSVLSRDADFYFFDEPSSYLDVRERLLVAKEIRNLAKSRVVMVVEHDLAVLDYLSDHIHIIYGNPGVFGVVSNPYGVRIGINTYLEGYIKEENMRFREKPIYFSKRAHISEKDNLFLEFPGLEKKFEGFSLQTQPGNLYKNEIIGILGPNSIGKTTFIRMLTGEIKPDKGEALKELKLSYKPQRLVITKEEEALAVSEFLERGVGKKFYESDFKRILFLLGVERNLDKSMKNLSGGELQAVFISSALGKEHDILLLDEPSAFLDVEQRLNMSKIIRNHIETSEASGFVIDHDLQVIDSISDRVMVFEGKPGLQGFGRKPCSLRDGMNHFLKGLEITFRRDPLTGRPRANKPDSQKDKEQKERGEYYYMG